MARNNLSCDICKLPCKHIVAKLFIAPVKPGQTRKTHSDYTAHADVGECCGEKIARDIKWQKRQKVPRKVKVVV